MSAFGLWLNCNVCAQWCLVISTPTQTLVNAADGSCSSHACLNVAGAVVRFTYEHTALIGAGDIHVGCGAHLYHATLQKHGLSILVNPLRIMCMLHEA